MSGTGGAIVPLCVDLDGTLIRNDVAWMALMALLRCGPAMVLRALLAALKGRAALKRFLSLNAPLDPQALHYNEGLLSYLETAKSAGRPLVLATAADQVQAEKVAAHIGLFDEVLSSDGRVNLKGARKAEALVSKYGFQGFDYAGDRFADFPVWKCARKAILARADAKHPSILVALAAAKGVHLEKLGVVGLAPTFP